MRTSASFNNINSFAIHIIFIKSRIFEIRNKYQNVKINIKPGLMNQDYGYNIAKMLNFYRISVSFEQYMVITLKEGVYKGE